MKTLNVREKRILALFILLFILMSCMLMIAARVLQSGRPSFVIYLGNGQVAKENALEKNAPDLIRFFAVQDSPEYGFVLPDSWDTSCLRIYLSGVDRVRIGDRNYRSGDPISLETDRQFTVKAPGNEAIYVTIRKTGGLPVLFLQTESGSSAAIHADKSVQEPGRLIMTDADGNVLFREDLSAVRARGNATFNSNKKPYQIKLEKPAALFGDKEGRTWCLLANALDRSLIHNTLALDLARYCGSFAYTPMTQPVDLYLNHDYKGTYILTEKVQTGENRVAICELEKEIRDLNPGLDFACLEVEGDPEYVPGARKYRTFPAEPADYTGGYILQINLPSRYDSEACGFVTNRGCPFTIQEPKYISEAESAYISSLFQRIENALYSEDGVDPSTGMYYADLLDLPTLVDRYMIAEVLNDYDGQYTYFFKDSDAVDARVYAGPVWDQDNILGVWNPVADPEFVHLAQGSVEDWAWYAQAAKHADFREAIHERYYETFRPAVEILLGRAEDPEGILLSVDDYAQEVQTSAQADFFRWKAPLSTEAKKYNASVGETFEESIAFLKDYLEKREAALDRFF